MEQSSIEKILDENNQENVILYDDKNNPVEFSQVAVIPLNEKIYVILAPVNKVPGVNENEALVFAVEEIEDEDCLVIVDDEEIIIKVFDLYYDLLREEGIMN